MYPLDTRGLFTKDSFLSELRKEQVRNDKTLQEINNQVTTRENYGLFGVSFLTYLIHDLPPNEILVKLVCMVQHMDYLADHLEARRMIFSFCLKIRSNQMHLFDAQINHLVYTLLQACSFSSEVWQKELDGSSSDKLLLQSYNNIITEYLYNPRSYPQKIVFDEHLSDVACIRFALFNVLYGTDMQPLQYNHDDTFKFSDAWVQLLKESKRSNAFLIETQVIENALRNPEKNLACYAMDLDPLTLSLSSDVFDTVIREACQSLIHTHPKFIPYITRTLIHLLQVGKSTLDEQMYQQYIRMCQAAWLEIFKRELDGIVFETFQKTSPTVLTVSKYCACLTQYARYTQQDMEQWKGYMRDIWNDYDRWRRVYLKSTNTRDDSLGWFGEMFSVIC